MKHQDEFSDGEGLKLPLLGADLDYIPHAIAARDSAQMFDALRELVPWRQDHIVIFGRETLLPRLTAWYGDPGRHYTYSGIVMMPEPWIEPLERARELAERLAQERFNSVLCNLYRHGQDGLAWHSDDEPELGPSPIIASVNLGARRRFLLRRKDDHQHKAELLLGDGDVLIMRGATQQTCEHSIPKTKKQIGERINLTFRRILVGGRRV